MVFAEHEGTSGSFLTSPLTRFGVRGEVEKPIVGGLFGFSAAEAAMSRQPQGWTPDLRLSAGFGLRF